MLERILKIEFLRNQSIRIQEQFQNLAEFIYVISHTSTSPCFSFITIFLLNASFQIRYKANEK